MTLIRKIGKIKCWEIWHVSVMRIRIESGTIHNVPLTNKKYQLGSVKYQGKDLQCQAQSMQDK